jgi:hypothetical protein
MNDNANPFLFNDQNKNKKPRNPAITLENPTPAYEYSGISRTFNSVLEITRSNE